MYRSDYTGPQPPARLVALIAQRGCNLHGQPLYRLVHSDFRRSPSGGTWIDWDDALSTAERKDGVNRPLRSVVETRMVLLYPQTPNKWILEKWCPPDVYGTPQDWYKPTTQGGTQLYIPQERRSIATLGEYPHRGDYENFGYAFPAEALTEAVILTAIGRIEHAIDKMPSTPEGRVLRRVFNAKQAEELKQRQYKAYAKEMLDETDFAFNGNPFISSAGHKRPHSSAALLKKLGIPSHHI